MVTLNGEEMSCFFSADLLAKIPLTLLVEQGILSFNFLGYNGTHDWLLDEMSDEDILECDAHELVKSHVDAQVSNANYSYYSDDNMVNALLRLPEFQDAVDFVNEQKKALQ